MQAPWGNSHFAPANPGEFDTAVNDLVAAGKQQQEIQAKAQQMVDGWRRRDEEVEVRLRLKQELNHKEGIDTLPSRSRSQMPI